MMILNFCMMPLKKILAINYIFGFLEQPMAKNTLWRVTIFFVYHRMGDIGGLFIAKVR